VNASPEASAAATTQTPWREGAGDRRQQHHPPQRRDLPAQGGHQVVLAEDGFDALAKVNDHVPELIFCDILMPRLDGYQTCAIIKRNPRFAHVPVIMLSSKDGLFDKARGRMVGSEDYLTKPFTKEQLLQGRAAVQSRRMRTACIWRTRETRRCPSRRSSWSTTPRPSCTT
jgi:twitching motility two-component system response regulator PilG